MGIDYEETNDEFYIFSGCNEENLTQKTKEGTRPKPKPVSLDTWKKLLEETLNTSEVNENWKEYYIPFLKIVGKFMSKNNCCC